MDSKYYTIRSKNPRWKFLDGYFSRAASVGHFLRHLGYKYYKKCSMEELNNAYETGAFSIKVSSYITIIDQPENEEFVRVNPRIVNRYLGSYGYILVIEKGSPYSTDETENLQFTNEEEANSWIKSHI